jgi:hypothetical protein
MSIFGIIKCDDKVFAGDKLQIDVSESFVAPNLAIATSAGLQISVDAGVNWYDITLKKQLSWGWLNTSGAKTITLRMTTATAETADFTKTVTVIDQVAQNLFSKDSDLYQYEPDIDSLKPKKWSSWNMIHLAAQEWITDWLDEKRIFDENGNSYTAADLLDKQQVKQLSCFKALEMIYEGNSNMVGDIYSIKRDKYKALANEKASRSQLKLDFNKDTVVNEGERTDLHTVLLRRG